MSRNVYINEPVPARERDRFVEIPKGNDRMFAVELRNHGRVQYGTATIWRWVAIVQAIRSRHHDACMSPKGKKPITVRSRKAGPIIVVCKPLPGPIKRLVN